MITPSFPLTATERVLPRLALDFTTGVLDSRVTVTRALNTATRVNSSGFIEVVNANLPRFDYNPATLAARGLLIEEARTNLFVQSQFQGSWIANAGTTTFLGTYVTSPDGTSNGRILNDTSSSVAAYVYQGVSFTSGTVYTMSVYVKKGVSRYFKFTSLTQAGTALFDLNNYSLSSVTGIITSATITDAGNGWYRCTATMTANATGTNNLGFGDFEAGPTGDLYYLWGAQVEAGAFATSYIPTVASTVLRNLDVVNMTGTNFSSWFNAAEGTFVVGLQKLSPSSQAIYGFEVAGASSAYSMRARLGTDARMQSVDNTVVQVDAQLAGSVPTTPAKYAMAYKASSYAGAADGAATVTVGSGSVPALSSLNIGSSIVRNIYARTIYYYPMRLTNNEVQAFSK